MADRHRFSFWRPVGVILAVPPAVVAALALWNHRTSSVEFSTEQSVVVQPISLSEYSELENLLAGRLVAVLESNQCFEIELVNVAATGKLTSSEQTSSGFTGYFLEGFTDLRTKDHFLQIPLVGTGKGPSAQAHAIRMASEDFMLKVANESILNTYCDYE